MSAASPRAATSARMAATGSSTAAAVSRCTASSAAKFRSKPGSAVASLSGIGDLAEALDPAPDLLGTRLQRGAVDNEAGGHVRDVLDLDEPVGTQGRAGLHEIDDVAAEPQHGRQLHRAIELDAFRLDAARGE